MLNKIGFYQLDNLINNRVPFLFLNMAESLLPWYSSPNKRHVETYEVLTTENDAMSVLEAKNLGPDQAVVLLCQDGKASLRLHNQLIKKSYTNVYVVDGGYQQIVTERE